MRVQAARAARLQRRFGCGVAILSGVLVALLVGAVATAVFYLDPGNRSAAASQIPAQPGSLAWNAKTPLTVLLLGTTSRAGQPDSADTMMVVSISSTARTLSLLSIPPNLWVSIPGFGQETLSTAYADGGVRLAQLTIQSVLHLPIPYYVVAGASAVRQLVDSVGGLQLPTSIGSTARMGSTGNVVRDQQYDGTRTLGYVAGPPATRIQRSQEVFRALVTQGLGADTLFRIPSILNDLTGSIQTNFPYDRVTDLAHLVHSIPSSRVRMSAFSVGDTTVSPYEANGTLVLLPNAERIRSLTRVLFSQSVLSSGPAVDVLNGSNVLGRAASLATWLQQSGVPVRKIASVPDGNYPTTQIWIPSGASASVLSRAKAIATLLQVPINAGEPHLPVTRVTVVIGQNYLDPVQQ